jgi:CHAD domain-containing protein
MSLRDRSGDVSRAIIAALFRHHLNLLEEAATTWREHPGEETLHDFRVALRQVRFLLRAQPEGSRIWSDELTGLGDLLGAVRDLDVIAALLLKVKADDPVLLETLNHRRAISHRAVERYMRGPRWRRIVSMGRRYILTLERTSADPVADVPLEKYVERLFRRYQKRLRASGSLASVSDAVMLHRFRIRLRRLRYLGGVFGDCIDKKQKRLIERVRDVEQRLGRVHDIDMALQFTGDVMASADDPAPKVLKNLRERQLEKFRSKWKKCRKVL